VDGASAAEAAVTRAGAAVFPSFRLVRVTTTSSTQDVVRAAAADGAAEGFCCVAEEQTSGRGRGGRSWVAAPGTALLTSLLLRRPAGVAAGVPLAAGLAVAEGVERLAGIASRLKWPNDVMVGGAKLAGILTEVEPGGGVVLGIGVNLSVPEFPAGVAGVSLHRLSPVPVSWADLICALLPPLARRLDTLEAGGIPALRRDWMARAAGVGEAASVVMGGRLTTGTVLGIDDSGALLLQGAEEVHRLVAGDVHLLRAAPPG
jgi:BirA family biotin operon repressor/biotin-[acetyl-CoA-carboxylase] ligase